VILGAIPPGCTRALDVGCGTGALTRRLRRFVPHVTGVDRDQRSIELARAHPGVGDVDYLLADFLVSPFEPESLGLITSIASLHHMSAEARSCACGACCGPAGSWQSSGWPGASRPPASASPYPP
jgi:2-polyprenyl-3-methyl-5-hydroxy-6-metoxy-1,4-benzoquinol methylase